MSRGFLVGLGAWLLGTVTATTGSMIAVNELAQHLLDPQNLQLSATAVDIDRSADHIHPTPAVSVSPTARATAHAQKGRHSATPSATPSARGSRPRSSPSPTPNSPSPTSTSPGTLLESADGSVMATCESAGAYLLYWSPDQGFEADDVVRGPAAVTSVVFQNSNTSLVMRVTCTGGKPVAHIGHDE